jgi:hypothetical protein
LLLLFTQTVTDSNGDNPVITSSKFSNSNTDHLPNGQIPMTPFLYAPHNGHTPYVPQHSATNASPYATIPSYHPAAPLPTIIPPSQQIQLQSISQTMPNTSIDVKHNHHQICQQAPSHSSPKYDMTENLIQYPELIITPKVKLSVPKASNSTAYITDLISTSPSLASSQHASVSLLTPITLTNSNSMQPTATSFADIWSYANAGSPLNLAQTAAATAVAAMGLLNNENNPTTEITNEILKELTTPTKKNK